MLNRAIFLDRDGTINEDAGYTHRRQDWRFLPGVVEALAAFKRAGYLLVVVSNQSGIGRGYYDEVQVETLHSWVNEQLRVHDAAIDAWYYCPHLPDAGCSCRKPQPGMIVRAARDLRINLKDSYMLGDRLSDAMAGVRAGCKSGIVGSGAIMTPQSGICVWPDLQAAARDIVGEICAGEG